jgi:hypothetical protein
MRSRPLALALVAALALLSPGVARAGGEDPRNVLLADLGLHVVGIGYQRTLSPIVALQVDADSYTPWTQNSDVLGLSGSYRGDVQGVILRGRAFFFPWGSAPRGFWLSPFGQGGVGWATRDDQKRVGSVWALGASAGWAFLLFSGHVHLALGLGAQYHTAEIPGGDGPPSFNRFYPTLDATLGWAF